MNLLMIHIEGESVDAHSCQAPNEKAKDDLSQKDLSQKHNKVRPEVRWFDPQAPPPG